MPANKLNICLITNEFPGLTETFITTKTLELSKKGHCITVIKNQETSLVNTTHLSLVKEAGIKIISAPQMNTGADLLRLIVRNPGLALKAFSFSLKIFIKNVQQEMKYSLLRKEPFDIIHVEFSGVALHYQKALEQTNAKTVVSCRGTAEKVKPLSDPNRKVQLQKLFETVTAIHCVSQDMANTILPYCSDSSKVFINRPSVDAGIFKRTKPYPAKGNTLHILSIGRFTFQKGYLIGLMAMKILMNKGVSFLWTIVGDGPLKEEMLFHIHTLGLNEVVHLAGKKNRDEVLELYNDTDVYLLSSVYEGIANVCLEAMSMEVPVVATRSGGMEEVIEHNKDGMLCEVYNAESIANAVFQLSIGEIKRKEMGRLAREKILDQFTIQRQANEFEEQYLKLVK